MQNQGPIESHIKDALGEVMGADVRTLAELTGFENPNHFNDVFQQACKYERKDGNEGDRRMNLMYKMQPRRKRQLLLSSEFSN